MNLFQLGINLLCRVISVRCSESSAYKACLDSPIQPKVLTQKISFEDRFGDGVPCYWTLEIRGKLALGDDSSRSKNGEGADHEGETEHELEKHHGCSLSVRLLGY